MIYITGDCHSDFAKFDKGLFPQQKDMTKDDFVIVVGDFGGVWYSANSPYYKQQEKALDKLDSMPFTTLFIDGNHENFHLLNAYPVEEWKGGKIHRIRRSVYHLMRGEMFDLNGVKTFALGGASSHDIDDGIIDPDTTPNWEEVSDMWSMQGKMFRIKNISWWEEELPSRDEFIHCLETLDNNEYKCDLLLTHCCSTSTQKKINPNLQSDFLTDFLEIIKKRLKYKKHYFGHYHMNKELPDNEFIIYEPITRIY